MSKFSNYPEKRVELYNQYLSVINNLTFTPRQIDVIACILHKNSQARIVHLLNIAPNTVKVHINSIKKIVRTNSVDKIINFVERSGRKKYLEEYYANILIYELFEEKLQIIARHLTRSITYVPDFSLDSIKNSDLLLLLDNLKTAKIKHIKLNFAEYNPEFQLYLLDEINKEYNINDSKKYVFLLFDSKVNLTSIENKDFIDFRNKKDYYSSVFKVIKSFWKSPKCDSIVNDFEQERENLNNLYIRRINASSNICIFGKSFRKIQVIFVFTIVVILLITYSYWQIHTAVDIKSLNSEFASIVTKLSTDNVTTKEKQKNNYKIGNQVKLLINNMSNSDVIKYFNCKELSSIELINCVYVMHAFATYLYANEHDGNQARKLLKQAKSFIETHIIHKNKMEIPFDELSAEELYVELDIVKNLPEIYTKIIYSLGITYRYHGNIIDAKKYFELSKILGNKLNMFEGFLSEQRGLQTIKKAKIEEAIKIDNIDFAISNLKSAINDMMNLRNDKNKYIVNYVPNNKSPEFIIPSDSLYNIITCHNEILQYYMQLMEFSSKIDITNYIQNVEDLLITKGKNIGTFDLFDESTNNRIIAKIYNNIGNILLKCYDRKIKTDNLQKYIKEKLELEYQDKLDFIESIFIFVKEKSRNTDYTKADAYDRLIRVNKRKLSAKTNLTQEKKLQIEENIRGLTIKRDNINKLLNRTQR